MDDKGDRHFLSIFSAEGAAFIQKVVGVVDGNPGTVSDVSIDGTKDSNDIVVPKLEDEDVVSCSTCAYKCTSVVELREHAQSEWHIYNLRRKMKLKDPLSEEHYENVIADEQDDSSGSSDTETEDSDFFRITGTSHIFFSTEDKRVVSCFRCLLTECSSRQADNSLMLASLQRIKEMKNIWIVLIVAGGHFAGAAFNNGNVLCHKTFHRYTVRKKQGGSQIQRDNRQQSKPQSAGASLRRYNEAALCNDIRSLLSDWSDHVASASLIFLRCSTYHRYIFYGEDSLKKGDPRIRSIPLTPKKPTFEEVRRVAQVLSSLHVYENLESVLARFGTPQPPIPRSTVVQKQKLTKPRVIDQDEKENESTDREKKKASPVKSSHPVNAATASASAALPQALAQRLYTTCKIGDVKALTSLLEQANDVERPLMRQYLQSKFNSSKNATFLHIVSASGNSEMLQFLLEHACCDPRVKNSEGQVAYDVAKDAAMRTVFVNFREHFPDRWNWKAARIPTLADLKIEAEKAEKALQRKQADLKAKEEAQKVVEAEAAERAKFLSLSDRDKRAMAAERRWQAQQQNETSTLRCFSCGTDLGTKKPFEYSDNNFCSVNCVKTHREKCAQAH